MDELGSETAEDSLNLTEGRVWGAMLDEYKGLIVGVDVRAVERVAGDNIDIGREVSLEGGDLGRLARGLASNNGTKLGGCTRSRLALKSQLSIASRDMMFQSQTHLQGIRDEGAYMVHTEQLHGQ
jgi:hypothetical protein